METADLDVPLGVSTPRDPNLDDRVDALLGGLDAGKMPATQRPQGRRRRVAFSGLALGLAFAAGLLLGWLAIGWWLWPIQWENSHPWELAPGYQARYVALVAAEHYHTGNVDRARQDLAGWDMRRLQELLGRMERQAADSTLRQQLVALRSALGIPPDQPSLWSSVLSRRPILLSMSLAVLPFATAAGLAAAPRAARWLCVELPEEEETNVPRAAAASELPTWLDALAGDEPPVGTAEIGASTGEGSPPTAADRQDAPGEPLVSERVRAEGDPTKPPTAVAVSLAASVAEPEEQEAATDELLKDLFGSLESADSQLETLAWMVEPIDARDLATSCARVLGQLRTLTARSTGV